MCHFMNKTTISGEKGMKKTHLNEGKATNTSENKTDVSESDAFLKKFLHKREEKMQEKMKVT